MHYRNDGCGHGRKGGSYKLRIARTRYLLRDNFVLSGGEGSKVNIYDLKAAGFVRNVGVVECERLLKFIMYEVD